MSSLGNYKEAMQCNVGQQPRMENGGYFQSLFDRFSSTSHISQMTQEQLWQFTYTQTLTSSWPVYLELFWC
jgi:hypothetical protein